ncbi:Inhibin beta B [Brachionus plicatilis]|uniref:Inhibin beta B n=1 Tax=Brachionus plicatilis TaxID=10195 RepID=A0A3M7SLX3_BRAPC|nr:Inhibin beta B [Brachionus plicatilis]
MNICILSLLNVIAMVNGEYSSYSQFRGASFGAEQQASIPSLRSLFNYTTYRDKLNKTSPCLFQGHKRDTHCQMVSFVDEEAYERSLQETRKMILSRLNLDSEPEIRINKNTLSFLDQLENKILKDKQQTVLQSSFDGASAPKKVFSSMLEAVHMSSRCGHRSHLCVTFDVPVENLMGSNGLTRRPVGAHLWLFIRTQATYESGIDDNFHLEVSSDHALSNSEIIYNLRYGWKKINISKVFKVGSVDKLAKDSVLKYTIRLKCFYDCSIGFSQRDMDTFFYEDTANILVSSLPGKKPLMSIDIEEESEMDKKRSKRRIETAEGERNYRSAGHTGHMTRTCRPSSGNKERECCLNQYQVDFDRLKWSSWIISPHSYSANFCSGGCNDPRKILFSSVFAFKLFAALSQASLNVDPFGINFTFISFLRSPSKTWNKAANSLKPKTLENKISFITIFYAKYGEFKTKNSINTILIDYWFYLLIKKENNDFIIGKKLYYSFNYGGTGVNSELKMRYNEQSKSRLNFEPSQLFETCCHPISMESLTITYVSGNNTLIRAVIPNMIVTGCGCMRLRSCNDLNFFFCSSLCFQLYTNFVLELSNLFHVPWCSFAWQKAETKSCKTENPVVRFNFIYIPNLLLYSQGWIAMVDAEKLS